MRIVVALLALLAACPPARPPAREPRGPWTRWRIDLRAEAETRAGEGASAEAAGALEPLARVERRLEIVLATAVARRFRDGSEGLLVVFERARDAGRAAPLPLEGRSIEVRRFGDGEVLAVDLAEHVVGGGRMGEVLDLLVPVLSPAPPDLPAPGASAARSQRWPMNWGPGRDLGWRGELDARWTLVGAEERAGRRAWRLRYAGAWRGRGRLDGASAEAAGEAEGEAWYGRRDLDLLAHRFDWSREVRARLGALPVVQRQRFAGTLERLP